MAQSISQQTQQQPQQQENIPLLNSSLEFFDDNLEFISDHGFQLPSIPVIDSEASYISNDSERIITPMTTPITGNFSNLDCLITSNANQRFSDSNNNQLYEPDRQKLGIASSSLPIPSTITTTANANYLRYSQEDFLSLNYAASSSSINANDGYYQMNQQQPTVVQPKYYNEANYNSLVESNIIQPSLNVNVSKKNSRPYHLSSQTQSPIIDTINHNDMEGKKGISNINNIELNESMSDLEYKLSVKRERNRRAAQKCRQKKLDRIRTMTEEIEIYERKIEQCRADIEQLNKRKIELRSAILQIYIQNQTTKFS